ncbi:HtaA domain-containing protein [Streptomyces sp. ID01-9D]|uniref:HtaA domain-containing protein n=1 Tax=Streptomyces sp. ID01-9D TaxID=3028659 RepID=UPI0029C15898|nr:HtaA domain-containing protein [Streptomyces sp. ID01-9D]MDX5571926.1 HtaA domain-containing protein [Streptomyces sp. ID01-9D]
MSLPRRGRLAALAALTVISVGTGVLAVPASAAPGVHAAAPAAAPGSTSASSAILVSGGSSWGFKESWVRYVTGSGGSVEVAGGATKDAAGLIGHPVRHGSVDPARRSADVRFGGSVTYAVPSHGITAITLANPRVVIKNGRGTLHVDLTTDLVAGEAPVTTPGVPLADLTATAGALDGSTLHWRGITATLTAEGAEVFAYQGRPMYPVGTVLDPLAVSGGVSVPTLTVSQVSGLGAETEVTISGKGYQPGRGVYLAQSIALPGTTYPSVYGNAVYVRQVGADGTFSVTAKLTETFTPSGAPAVDCRTTACFVTSFNAHDGGDPTWMPSRAQDVAQPLQFGVEAPAPAVTRHPASRTVRSGATDTFTAAATGGDTVRWERSTDRGATWSTVAKDGTWRARYAGTADRAAAVSSLDSVDVKLRTAVSGFNASPEPVRKGRTITVKGTLRSLDGTWKNTSGQSVVILFKADGSSKWSKPATVRTNSHGVFSKGFTAKKAGTWKAQFTATSARLGTTSSGDRVDVR